MFQDVVPPRRRRPKPKSIERSEEPAELPMVVDAPDQVPFKTPEETAAEDVRVTSTATTPDTPQSSKKRFRIWRPHGRKQWIITAVTAAILVVAGGGTAWALTRHTQPAPVAQKPVIKKASPPKPIYSDLSGLPITDPSLNSKPVTAVMIENSTDARPQSGLSQAGIVFEAQAEGGITRFMALYQDTAPDNVGPIRSARPYYIQWALGFDAAYAHVGGSPDALSDIGSWGVQDMNQFYNGNYYHRITTRAAPHNVYTGISTLNQLESSKGYTSTFTGFPRAASQQAISQPTASSIDLAVSSALYNPHYDFDPTTNTYKRSTDGTPDTDANTGQQLAPTVVIAIVVPLSQGALDASGAYYSDYNVIGTGTAYVFQNGGVTVGEWHKASNTDQITFTDNNGTTVPLNRGQTWITAVSAASQVSYKGTAAPSSSTTTH
ncbi:MAG TPA: DUF3048 domain-containing protein, partial [Verrucomicrobiae bacterium]|nr:DUF3048 domain-containing protein [Verrucomicrobiae bacterium]